MGTKLSKNNDVVDEMPAFAPDEMPELATAEFTISHSKPKKKASAKPSLKSKSNDPFPAFADDEFEIENKKSAEEKSVPTEPIKRIPTEPIKQMKKKASLIVKSRKTSKVVQPLPNDPFPAFADDEFEIENKKSAEEKSVPTEPIKRIPTEPIKQMKKKASLIVKSRKTSKVVQPLPNDPFPAFADDELDVQKSNVSVKSNPIKEKVVLGEGLSRDKIVDTELVKSKWRSWFPSRVNAKSGSANPSVSGNDEKKVREDAKKREDEAKKAQDKEKKVQDDAKKAQDDEKKAQDEAKKVQEDEKKAKKAARKKRKYEPLTVKDADGTVTHEVKVDENDAMGLVEDQVPPAAIILPFKKLPIEVEIKSDAVLRGEALGFRWLTKHGHPLPDDQMIFNGAKKMTGGWQWHSNGVWVLPSVSTKNGLMVEKRCGAVRDERFEIEIKILTLLKDCPFVPKLLHVDKKNRILKLSYCGGAPTESIEKRLQLDRYLRILEEKYGVYRTENIGKKLYSVQNNNVTQEGDKLYIIDFGSKNWHIKDPHKPDPTKRIKYPPKPLFTTTPRVKK